MCVVRASVFSEHVLNASTTEERNHESEAGSCVTRNVLRMNHTYITTYVRYNMYVFQ